MRYLRADLPWDRVTAIGFDLDGTLYDEFDFIAPAYGEVAKALTPDPDRQVRVHGEMLARWLEKGSSYPHIFQEALEGLGVDPAVQNRRIERGLAAFRAFQPVLGLSARMTRVLEDASQRYHLFLISDGNGVVQRRKIEALGLMRYFRAEDICVSGDHGADCTKPAVGSISHVAALQARDPREVAYVGDRERDREFAARAGFHFVHISTLFPQF